LALALGGALGKRQVLARLLGVGLHLRDLRPRELDERLAHSDLVPGLHEERRPAAVERRRHALGVVLVDRHAPGEDDARRGPAPVERLGLDELQARAPGVDLDGVVGTAVRLVRRGVRVTAAVAADQRCAKRDDEEVSHGSLPTAWATSTMALR